MLEAATAFVTTKRPLSRAASPASAEMDALLARVAADGDRAAFARFYDYFAPRVKAYLLRIGAASEQAEDLAQEAMLKVWTKAALFDREKASASTWVYTIARNLRIDALRRANRPDLDGSDPALAPEEEPRADDVCDRKERDVRIRRAFAALPPNQHQVVALHFFEDEPHTAIAARLNLPLGTVKSRLRLAFDKIRKELGELT